ncbi:MAG: DUF1284 domain-containing protein [Flavobacteriaceae bacterium]|nr:DUF1284 domain-containing protein [Flavobacteriaceae bacterium]
MIKLRPHHLLCSMTFTGQGYSAEFVKNYHAIIKRMRNDETIEIVSGPDEICLPVCSDPMHHCFKNRILSRDKKVLEDFSRHTNLNIKIGSMLKPTSVFTSNYRQIFSSGKVRNGCISCEWIQVCNTVSKEGFRKGSFAVGGEMTP